MKYAAYVLIVLGAYLLFQDDVATMGVGIAWIVLGGLILRSEPASETDDPGPFAPA